MNQQFDRWMTVGLMAMAVILLPLLSSSFIMVNATSPVTVPLMLVMSVGMSMVSMLIIWTMLGPDAWRILFTVELALVVWQMLRGTSNLPSRQTPGCARCSRPLPAAVSFSGSPRLISCECKPRCPTLTKRSWRSSISIRA